MGWWNHKCLTTITFEFTSLFIYLLIINIIFFISLHFFFFLTWFTPTQINHTGSRFHLIGFCEVNATERTRIFLTPVNTDKLALGPHWPPSQDRFPQYCLWNLNPTGVVIQIESLEIQISTDACLNVLAHSAFMNNCNHRARDAVQENNFMWLQEKLVAG